ncbi:MAG TPA: RNA methyltransferase [Caulobacteraceae bacterium]|nr:RNA methyltransferase [Caulobacteraceae bacterium]
MPAVIAIDDPDDPRIAGYRAVRERDLVGREGLFVAEGEVVLRMLAASRRFAPVSALVAQKRVSGLAPILETLPDGVPVYAAGQAVLDAIVGFPIHRGVLALGRRTETPSADELLADLPARALVVGLFGSANHDNVGGVFRNAAAFGADAVILDPTCCDPLYRKAIRVSIGGVLTVPFARLGPGEDALALFARRGFMPIALSPAGETPLTDLRRPDRVVALLGAEGPGLQADLLSRARTVRIPMAPGFDSLNLATTSGVVLHHLAFG